MSISIFLEFIRAKNLLCLHFKMTFFNCSKVNMQDLIYTYCKYCIPYSPSNDLIDSFEKGQNKPLHFLKAQLKLFTKA